jgi:hypothetical protein
MRGRGRREGAPQRERHEPLGGVMLWAMFAILQVHNALKAAKEAERARKKGKDPKKEDKDKKKDEKKSVVTDEMPRKKLLGLVEFSVELNPAKPEPPEGGE